MLSRYAHRLNPGYSVRGLLVIYVIVPLLLALGLGWLLAVRQLERFSEQRMQEEIELVARAIQLPLGYALEQGRLQSLQQSLESAAVINRVYGASVYDANGDLVLSVGAQPDVRQPRVPQIVVDGDQRGEYGRTAGRRTYSYFVPLSGVSGTVNGVLQVTRERRDFDEYFDGLRSQAFVALGGVTVLMVLMLLLGHHLAVGRFMQQLATTMNIVESGDSRHRAAERGPREVRTLASSLNAMLDSINRAQSKILEQRRIQTELERRLHSAEKLAAMGGLAAGVAHELGTPLSVVDGHAQRLLRLQNAGEDGSAAAAKIREQVRRMEAIVRQLLDFGKRRRGEERLVKIEEVVGSVCTAMEELAGEKGVKLRHASENCDLAMRVDVTGLSQAVTNLVRNAIQSTPGGNVEVRVECTPSEVLISVDDDGPGIPGSIKSRIFEPFFTTKPVGEGTGLGLALTHRVIDDMGGRITARRSGLGGAQFLVSLKYPSRQERETAQ